MRHRSRVVLAAALAGLGVALVVTLLQPSTYRASGVLVLTREGRAPGDDPTLAPAAEAAAELLESRAVAESATANLNLEDSAEELLDRVEVDVGAQSSLLALSVEAGEPEEARQAAQEVAEVFTVLYNTRFGPATTAAIWEVPRVAEERVAPRPWRNAALGLLGGACAGIAFAALRRRPSRRPATSRSSRASRAEPVAGPPWTMSTLERVAAEPSLGESRRRELERLVEAIREFSPGGSVPRRLDELVAESFGDLVSAGATPAGRASRPRRATARDR